ncbi:unnamed protein product [Protopolystoma xenopodis]|uniref:Uncharacterized protein n=1 Tax=Protopolystoma xenopodis TaxID=117903 RepID=A0A448X5T6_9PLAT|nr:unnamed protein product [Protopolystoma xenopodis]
MQALKKQADASASLNLDGSSAVSAFESRHKMISFIFHLEDVVIDLFEQYFQPSTREQSQIGTEKATRIGLTHRHPSLTRPFGQFEFIRSCLVYESFSDGSHFSDLSCAEILVRDTRYLGNIFTLYIS